MHKFDKDNDDMLHFGEFIEAFVHSPLMKVTHLKDELNESGSNARAKVQKLDAGDWVQITGAKASSLKRYVLKEMEEAEIPCLRSGY